MWSDAHGTDSILPLPVVDVSETLGSLDAAELAKI